MDNSILKEEVLDGLPISKRIDKLEELVRNVAIDDSSSSYHHAQEIFRYIEKMATTTEKELFKEDTELLDLIRRSNQDLKEDYKYRNSKKRKVETISRFKSDFEDVILRIRTAF